MVTLYQTKTVSGQRYIVATVIQSSGGTSIIENCMSVIAGIPQSNAYAIYADEKGDLYANYLDGVPEPDITISSDGNLYLTI